MKKRIEQIEKDVHEIKEQLAIILNYMNMVKIVKEEPKTESNNVLKIALNSTELNPYDINFIKLF